MLLSLLCSALALASFAPLKPGLTPLWAQELVGADLVEYSNSLERVPVGVLDSSFAGYSQILKGHLSPQLVLVKTGLYSTHGAAVAALIGADEVGASKLADFRLLHSGNLTEDLLLGLGKVESTGVEVVNLSSGISSQTVTDRINALAEDGIIFVTSAGNSAPRIPNLDLPKQTIHAIVVGSVEIDGSVSSYSQEGANVALYAPGAAPYVLSLEEPYSPELGKGNETSLPPKPLGFGMTSATSPLVAGAVVNLKAYLPDLDFPSAKEILMRTGTPLPGAPEKVLLNEYKAVRVAERLAKEKNWRAQLEKKDLYDFSAEAAADLRIASGPNIRSNEKIALLRKAFLLLPDPQVAQNLAEALRVAGWEENAVFFSNFSNTR